MKKQVLCLFPLLAVFLFLLVSFPACAEENSVLRALLIGCDEFVTMPSITPAAENNLKMLSITLQNDQRGYDTIVTAGNTLRNEQDLREILDTVFYGARGNDLSFIYFGTHGVISESGEYSIVLSDGKEESTVSGALLRDLLNRIPGQKLLVLDTCYSGAFIGKGMNDVSILPLFSEKDISVFCACGGCELSFCFSTKPDGSSEAASFFCNALCQGLSSELGYPADLNQDGLITLYEMETYLPEHYGVSTPQVYPEGDRQSIFFSYDPAESPIASPLLDGLIFEEAVIDSPENPADFSYLLHREALVYYQLVCYREGKWQFDQAREIADPREGENLQPGFIRRSITLADENGDDSGYVLINLITLSGDGPQLQGGHLITVQNPEEENLMSLECGGSFDPEKGEEMPFILRHTAPAVITACILNEQDKSVRLLTYDLPSRPQNLTPDGTCLYWNGRDDRGEACPPGSYRLQVEIKCGEKKSTLLGQTFSLTGSE